MIEPDDFADGIAAVIFAHDDDTVILIIGSGAGGGAFANELAQKGIDVSGLFATGVFTFLFAWNEFGFALVLTRDSVLTFPVHVSHYFGALSTYWGKVGVISIIGTLPVFFAVAFLQRYLVRGMSLGALKG